jgi:hypothetical protein
MRFKTQTIKFTISWKIKPQEATELKALFM